MNSDSTVRFVLLTTQRAGSSWLLDMIDHCDGAEGHMELFLDHRRRKPATAGSNDYPRFIESGLAGSRRPLASWRYLNGLYARPLAAVGFKLMYSHLRQFPEIIAYMAVRRVSVVHLYRQNLLDVILSERIAEISGSSHVVKGDSKPTGISAELNPDRTVQRIRRLENNLEMARSLTRWMRLRSIEISYEQLLSDEAVFPQVCRFLGLRVPEQLQSNLAKRQVRPKSEVITNYPKLAEALRDAGYERFLIDA